MLEYYIIAALSFALMYAYNYGYEIVKTVADVLYMFDNVNYAEANWYPVLYVIMSFVAAFAAAPLFLLMVLFQKRYETVKYASGRILEKHFGFKKQEDEK